MALKRLRYRISRFGTIALPQEVRRATFCILKLEMQAIRGITYYSKERIPDQTVHGWITARDADGYVVNKDWDWRFDKQRWLLWELTDFQVTLNQCFIANKQTEVLLAELAKKPNTPPLPPSIPPVNYDSFFGRVPIIIHGYESITVKTRVSADFDVELIYDTREESRCSPVPTEIPRGPAPIENELPKPGGQNGVAPGPLFPIPAIPVNQGPIGGTSKIPEGYQGPDQVGPPNAGPVIPPGATQTRVIAVGQTSIRQGNGQCQTFPVREALGSRPGIFAVSQVTTVEATPSEPRDCGTTSKNLNVFLPAGFVTLGYNKNWLQGPTFEVEYF